MESLKNLLPKSLTRSKAQKQLHASVVISSGRKALIAMFGEIAAERIHLVSLRDKVLKIVCDEAAYAQEILLRESDIIRRINEKMASEEVVKITASC